MTEEKKQLSQTYYRRKLKANKLKRKISSKKRQIRTLRVFVRLALILLLIASGILILKLPQWHINQNLLMTGNESVLKIFGNNITPSYKIVDMVRQTQLPDTEIFRLDTKELEHNIAQLEPVRKVYIRRFWLPARLLIIVEERKPVFTISPNLESPPISTITQDGVFIGRDYMPLNEKIKTTKILSYGVRGDDYEKWNKARVDEILKIIKTVETYSKQKVQYIDLRNPKDVYIQLDDVMIRIGEINSKLYKRFEGIVTILPEIKNIKHRVQYVDLRWEEVRYIKMKSDNS